ncbi:hypothetical protein KCP73_10130 [Salmonella enterica subsp. enterica]|nr:hypothetical protein KCP73_10130 [Salmonella enterica subsp. enterica]
MDGRTRCSEHAGILTACVMAWYTMSHYASAARPACGCLSGSQHVPEVSVSRPTIIRSEPQGIS